jgi:threonine/homoserine/homoserine lactone efflux protein
LGFVLAPLPLIVTLGFSFTLATQKTLAGRTNAGPAVALGTGLGVYVHSLLAAGGLVTLLVQWPAWCSSGWWAQLTCSSWGSGCSWACCGSTHP